MNHIQMTNAIHDKKIIVVLKLNINVIYEIVVVRTIYDIVKRLSK